MGAALASDISVCGISASIATGDAIKALPIVPVMISNLIVVFAVIERDDHLRSQCVHNIPSNEDME